MKNILKLSTLALATFSLHNLPAMDDGFKQAVSAILQNPDFQAELARNDRECETDLIKFLSHNVYDARAEERTDLNALRIDLWARPPVRPLMVAIRDYALRDGRCGRGRPDIFSKIYGFYAQEALHQLQRALSAEERPELIQVHASLFTQTFVR